MIVRGGRFKDLFGVRCYAGSRRIVCSRCGTKHPTKADAGESLGGGDYD